MALGLTELVLVLFCFHIATLVLLGPNSYVIFSNEYGYLKIFFAGVVCFFSMYLTDFYDSRIVTSRREAITRFPQVFGLICIILGVSYYFFPSLGLGRGILLLGASLLAVLLALWRLGFIWYSRQHIAGSNALVLGDGSFTSGLLHEVELRPESGLRIVGIVADGLDKSGASNGDKVLGSPEELLSLVREYNVERVIVALADRRGRMPLEQLWRLKALGITVEEGISVYETVTGKTPLEALRPSWLLFDGQGRSVRHVRFLQQICSFVITVLALILAAPLMLMIAVLIKLDSRGPVFYKQERVGHLGKTFVMYKFRTMREEAEVETGPVWAISNDSRVTRVGRFLRKWRLDELPQFINVGKGEMNLVGPRPERPAFVEQLRSQIPFYDARHAIRPGVTGWAQINYKYANSVADSTEKLQYDLFYLKHGSVGFDLMVMFQTLKVVLAGRGAH